MVVDACPNYRFNSNNYVASLLSTQH